MTYTVMRQLPLELGLFLHKYEGKVFTMFLLFFFFRKSTIKPVGKGEVTQLCRLQRCSAIIQTRDRPTGSLHFLRDTNASPLDVVVQAYDLSTLETDARRF